MGDLSVDLIARDRERTREKGAGGAGGEGHCAFAYGSPRI